MTYCNFCATRGQPSCTQVCVLEPCELMNLNAIMGCLCLCCHGPCEPIGQMVLILLVNQVVNCSRVWWGYCGFFLTMPVFFHAKCNKNSIPSLCKFQFPCCPKCTRWNWLLYPFCLCSLLYCYLGTTETISKMHIYVRSFFYKCRTVPERVYPFSKGICRNLYDFCCAYTSIYSIEPLPTVQELEHRARPYTCVDIVSCRCC